MFCHLDYCHSAEYLPTECVSAILVPPQGTKYIGELQKNSSSCREKHFQEEEKSPKMAKN